MAKPQLEDGYTMIANEILENLMRIQLPANQWQVLLCVIRKTYGFRKKVDRIANFQICEATGLRKDVVSRSLHKLEAARIIVRNSKTIGFQKDYQQWELAEQPTNESLLNSQQKLAEQPTELAEQPTKVDSPHVTQKKKETIQKKKEKDRQGTKDPDPLNEQRDKIFEELKKRRGYNSPVSGAEAKAITWVLKQGYSVEQIMACYDAMKQDKFWGGQFLNMQNVKKQIGEFAQERRRESRGSGGKPFEQWLSEQRLKPRRLPTDAELDIQAKEKGVPI